MSKYYDMTMAIEMMYELKKQGMKDVSAFILDTGLAVACNPDISDTSESSYPEVEGDFEDAYYLTKLHHGFKGRYLFWWIFD